MPRLVCAFPGLPREAGAVPVSCLVAPDPCPHPGEVEPGWQEGGREGEREGCSAHRDGKAAPPSKGTWDTPGLLWGPGAGKGGGGREEFTGHSTKKLVCAGSVKCSTDFSSLSVCKYPLGANYLSA